MNKAINTILGIGVAIVLFLFFILAFKIIFEEPEWNDCWENMSQSKIYEDPATITESQRAEFEAQEKEIQECNNRNTELNKIYSQKVFYATIIVGIVLILAMIPLLPLANIAAGVAAAGLALFVYGLSVGWNSANEYAKLLALFVAAIVVISLAVWLNLRRETPKKKK